jgi:hypothetical protein
VALRALCLPLPATIAKTKETTMKYSNTKLGGAAFLTVALCGSALAQSLTTAPTTQQVQNMTRMAEKAAIISGGVGLGVTVIALALHHRHHSPSTKSSSRTSSQTSNYQALPAAFKCSSIYCPQSAGALGKSESTLLSPAVETSSQPQVKTADNLTRGDLTASSLLRLPVRSWTWQDVFGNAH